MISDERTSVVIISFNCWKDLNICIGSIKATRFPFHEIIVVDNASVDGTSEKLRSGHPDVRVFRNSINIGHVRAANQIFRLIEGERILLLDADTVLAPESLHILSAFMDENPEAWMAAPKIFNTDGSIQEGNRRFPTPINGMFGRQSFLTRMFPKNRFSRRYLARDLSHSTEPFRVESVGACCMYFRKRVLDEVGYWDEKYFGYFVDSDWCKRIELRGGTIYSVPAATIVHHDQNRESRKKDPLRIIGFHTGAYRFYCKYYTGGPWDMRRVVAADLLFFRTVLLLLINAAKSSDHAHPDALMKQRAAGKDCICFEEQSVTPKELRW